MSESDYRFCIYCGTDCIDFPNMEPDHRDDCPQKTGLYPYPDPCAMPGEPESICCRCEVPFKEAGFYVQIPMEPIEETPCYEIVCVGCGALAVANGA